MNELKPICAHRIHWRAHLRTQKIDFFSGMKFDGENWTKYIRHNNQAQQYQHMHAHTSEKSEAHKKKKKIKICYKAKKAHGRTIRVATLENKI